MSSDIKTVSIRMPLDYHEKMRMLARKDDRATSNFAWQQLKKIIDEATGKTNLDKSQDNTARA